jgi:hypothetical protein
MERAVAATDIVDSGTGVGLCFTATAILASIFTNGYFGL